MSSRCYLHSIQVCICKFPRLLECPRKTFEHFYSLFDQTVCTISTEIKLLEIDDPAVKEKLNQQTIGQRGNISQMKVTNNSSSRRVGLARSRDNARSIETKITASAMSSISTTTEGTTSQKSFWQKDIHKVNTSIQTTNSPVTSITSMTIGPTSLRNPSIQVSE